MPISIIPQVYFSLHSRGFKGNLKLLVLAILHTITWSRSGRLC
ncbi:hypothetical protein OROHE_017300 [Orobanche hederae]